MGKTTNKSNVAPETVVELSERTIVRTTKSNDKQQKNRYYFELDGESFEGHNKDGEVIETNSISKSIISLWKEVGIKGGIFHTIMSMVFVNPKATINPMLVSMCLNGAKVKVTRILKLKGESMNTEDENQTFDKDTWVSKITDITLNIDSITMQVIMQYIANPKSLVVEEKPVVADITAAFAAVN